MADPKLQAMLERQAQAKQAAVDQQFKAQGGYSPWINLLGHWSGVPNAAATATPHLQKTAQPLSFGDRIALEQAKNEARARVTAKKDAAVNEKEDQAERIALSKGDAAKRMETLMDLDRKLGDYTTLIEKHGYQTHGAAANLIKSKYSELLAARKEADRLGALTGPDMELMSQALSFAPVGFSPANASSYKLGGGQEGLLGTLKQGREAIKSSAAQHVGEIHATFPGEGTAAQKKRYLNFAYPSEMDVSGQKFKLKGWNAEKAEPEYE